MAASLGDAILYLRTNDSGLSRGLDSAEKKTRGWARRLGGGVGKLVGGLAISGIAAGTAAIVGMGVAALNVEGEFRKATNAIIEGTGASGEALQEMEQSVRNLKKSSAGLGHDFETIGTTLAEVNTRTGATGQQLEDLTGQILQFSRVTGTDAVQNTRLITRVMGDWGVAVEDGTQLLDQLHGAGQAFGISTDFLSQKLVQFGAPLRQMGFTLEESIALFGKWEKEGVNAELAIGSLRIAAGKFAADGIPLREGLLGVMDAIKGAATESEALSIAMDTFGARAGPDMAAAIREGRFELDSAIEALRGTAGGLDDAARRTLGFREQWQVGMAQVQDAMLPLGQKLAELGQVLVPLLVSAFQSLLPVLTSATGFVADLVGIIAMAIEDGWSWQEVIDALPASLQGVVKALGAVVSFIKARFVPGVGSAQSRFKFLKTWFDRNMPLIRRTVITVLNAIQAFWSAHGEAIMTLVGNTFDSVLTIITTTMQAVLGIIRAIMLAINGDWAGAWNELKNVASAILAGVKTIVQNQLDSMVALIRSLGGSFYGAGVALVSSLWAGIRNRFARLIDDAKAKLAELRALLPFSEPKDPSSPLRGLVRSGEAIIGQVQKGIDRASLNINSPAATLLGATGGTGAVTISVSQEFRGSADADSVARASRQGLLSALREAGLA